MNNKDNQSSENAKKKKSKSKNRILFSGGLLFGIIPFLFIVYLLMTPLIKIIHKDFKAETMFVISKGLNIRSDKSGSAYVIGSYDYGTEVQVYEIYTNEWAEVSIGEKKGFMSMEYLVNPETFYIINGLFGNDLAKANITKTTNRKAIASYFIENNYISNIPIEIRDSLYGEDTDKEVWQIFAEEGYPKYNAYCYGDFNGDNEDDVAIIIKNTNTGKTKLIILEIDTKIQGKYSNLLYSKDLAEEWFFIKKIKKGNKLFLTGDKKEKIILDGILIGTNRNKDFNDSERLLIYDGHTFNIFDQNQ